MIFSKRHYEWLARFAHEIPQQSRRQLANALERDHTNFDRKRFEDAAGITEYNEGVKALIRSATP